MRTLAVFPIIIVYAKTRAKKIKKKQTNNIKQKQKSYELIKATVIAFITCKYITANFNKITLEIQLYPWKNRWVSVKNKKKKKINTIMWRE